MGFRARRQGFLDGGAQSRAFVVAVVVPALGGNPVEVRIARRSTEGRQISRARARSSSGWQGASHSMPMA